MFIDTAKIFVKSGDGGHGSVSFRREKYVPLGGPDGGDGGKGGDVTFVVDPGMTTLLDFKYKRKFVAGRGQDGQGSKCYGRDGENLTIKVPMGTIIRDVETNGGYGGYSFGQISISKNDNIYIQIGGNSGNYKGGYNGGGSGNYDNIYNQNFQVAGGGGGADCLCVPGRHDVAHHAPDPERTRRHAAVCLFGDSGGLFAAGVEKTVRQGRSLLIFYLDKGFPGCYTVDKIIKN